MQDYIKERSDRLFNFSNKFSKIDLLLGKCELPKNIFSDLAAIGDISPAVREGSKKRFIEACVQEA